MKLRDRRIKRLKKMDDAIRELRNQLAVMAIPPEPDVDLITFSKYYRGERRYDYSARKAADTGRWFHTGRSNAPEGLTWKNMVRFITRGEAADTVEVTLYSEGANQYMVLPVPHQSNGTRSVTEQLREVGGSLQLGHVADISDFGQYGG